MSVRPLRTNLSKNTMRLIGIPRFLLDKNIDDFDTFNSSDYIKVKSTVKDYINNINVNFQNSIGITLFGSNGSGKTMLASIIIKEAYRHRYSAYRVTFAEYISVCTRVWEARGLDEKTSLEEEVYKYKSAEFLALEEVGKEIDTSIAAPILEDILRYREDKGLPIILCTNLPMSTIEERYGMSVYSLIKGNTIPIKIEGEDKRKYYFRKRGSNDN